MYHDHLKFCLVCINDQRYVCCSESYVVSDERDEPTPISAHGDEVIYFGSYTFQGWLCVVCVVMWCSLVGH